MRVPSLTTGTAHLGHAFLTRRPAHDGSWTSSCPGLGEPLPIHCSTISPMAGSSSWTPVGPRMPASSVLSLRRLTWHDPPRALERSPGTHGRRHRRAHPSPCRPRRRGHVRQPVLRARDRVTLRTAFDRVSSNACSGEPLPAASSSSRSVLDGGPFGAFATSRSLTDNRRIVTVRHRPHTQTHLRRLRGRR